MRCGFVTGRACLHDHTRCQSRAPDNKAPQRRTLERVLFQGEPFAWKLRETYEPMPVWWPKTWLLSEGWRRYGLISTHEVPSKRFAAHA